MSLGTAPRWRLWATTLLTGALLLGPGLALRLLPRPQAAGLERILPQTSLLQSFAAAPERPAPLLWQQRLGPRLAERLWRQQRDLWWQFWSRDGDGGAFLAIPAPRLVRSPGRPAAALQVDDLLVVAPDPLSRQQLQQQLAPVSGQRRGLERRCLERLQRGQAVYWSPIGLAELTGPLAALLQPVRQGCLSLAASRQQRLISGLQLDGEATAVSGALAAAPAGSAGPAPAPPLPDATLLELTGPRLAPLLDSLLARQLIREPLAARYGLADPQVKLLTSVPFRLRLRAIARGPFQAGLELQLAVGGQRKPWAKLLEVLRSGLLAQGQQEGPAQLTPTPGTVGSQTLPATRFLRDDGAVAGGWRWQAAAGGDPQLVLFLGPPPPLAGPLPAVPAGSIRLELLPARLERLGLMPRALPQVVRQAERLQLQQQPARGGVSQLSGRLRLAATGSGFPPQPR